MTKQKSTVAPRLANMTKPLSSPSQFKGENERRKDDHGYRATNHAKHGVESYPIVESLGLKFSYHLKSPF
ncbi:MAG: hypothetical protein LAN36_11435 [Acidobacteriia bacterium]|nr:hypothetical protein [Terriglobia bacterium]